PERDRDQGSNRECRALRERPDREAEVLKERLDAYDDVGVARLFTDAHPPAKALDRIAARVLRRHAGGDVVLDARLDVVLQLLVDLGVEVAASKDVGEAIEQRHKVRRVEGRGRPRWSARPSFSLPAPAVSDRRR